jgi:hypothetical protein
VKKEKKRGEDEHRVLLFGFIFILCLLFEKKNKYGTALTEVHGITVR